MTIRPLSRAEVRSIDARAAEELGLPGLALMENAGRGAADVLLARLPAGARVVVACGPGNNGGDGGVVARHLDAAGAIVDVLWFADPGRLAGDARVQHDVLDRAGIPQVMLATAEALDPFLDAAGWIVDALLGTGLTRPVEGLLREVIEAINRSGKPVLALDLPSGLDADSGQPLGVAVRARETVTFVAPKLGFSAPGASSYTGTVHVAPIGVPRCLLEPFLAG